MSLTGNKIMRIFKMEQLFHIFFNPKMKDNKYLYFGVYYFLLSFQ